MKCLGRMQGAFIMENNKLDVINVREFKDIDDIQVVLHSHEQLYSTNLKALVKQIMSEVKP